jgi:Caspase domain
MNTQRIRSTWAPLGSTIIALLLTVRAPLAAECTSSQIAPEISVQMPAQATIRAGEPVEIQWSSMANGTKNCRQPLYLVFTTNARVRFEGEGFLAIAPGGKGPYGIAGKLDQTRVFIPLHALPEMASGSFKIKFYSAAESAVDWFVTRVSADFRDEKKRTSTVLAVAKQPLTVKVGSGKPTIVVRDAFTPDIATGGAAIERPTKKIVSNSNEFELQVFDKFYRVYDVRTGELVLERAGINPNFSPSSRFIGAFAEGSGFEIADLYADTVIATSGALNRHGGYAGTAHLAAWSRDDAVLALSFWGYGGVYVRQTLVDGPGIGDGMASCHACQGIGTTLSVNYDSGIVAWSGQEQGWGTFFDPATGSRQAKAEAEREIPLLPDYTNLDRQSELQQKLSSEYLTKLGRRYLFDAAALLNELPKDSDVTNYDGKAWHLGDELRLSHACTQDAADNCSSLGVVSADGRAALKLLASKRIEHRGLKKDGMWRFQPADARLIFARAAARGPAGNRDRNIWARMQQLGVPLSDASRAEVPVQSFKWDELSDNPAPVTSKLTAKIPAIGEILVNRSGKDSLEPPGHPGQGEELKQIDPKKVRHLANWTIGGTEYWLIHQDYQSGNSATPMDQYLHLVSGNASGLSSVIDLSTRVAAGGFLAKSTDQDGPLENLWPSDFDIVTIVRGRYLLASGHWLHDADRWGLVYDLKENKTLLLNGYLPNATATKSLSITDNGRLFAVTNSNGQIYFYNINSGKQVLSGNYVDDEMVIYDPNGYYMSTYEGSQFVFLKFPGTPGYLSFKQFAKALQRPDIVKGIFYGTAVSEAPDLAPPPRLSLSASDGAPGELHLSVSAVSSRELAKLRFFVDGQLWREQTIGGLDYHLDDDMTLPAQTRWLTALAVDAAGSESVPIARAIPQDSRPSSRKLFVFGIGTDGYVNLEKSLQLHFAVSDAKNFMSAVKTQKSGYYRSIEEMPFLNAHGLKTALPAKLRSVALSATEDDTIMLFVSGHGYKAPDNTLYLVLAETDADRIEETALSWDELARAFDGTKARIVVFIDACHSGAVPDGGSNDEIADALSARQVRFTVIAAAKGRQESFEEPSLGGGVFTSAIVKAITGNRAAIDTNNNGVIELSELYSKIKPQVLTEMRGQQTPWLARADMVGEVPLF